MIVAIDPGLSGCIAVLASNGDLQAFMHMPVIKVGSSNRVNGAAVQAFLAEHKLRHCYVEKVASMPKQGVASTFNFGHAAGLVEGVIAGAGIPLTLVTPQRWKKHAGLMGKDKDASRARCVQLYPSCREFDLKTKGQALADAVLIGRYGLSA